MRRPSAVIVKEDRSPELKCSSFKSAHASRLCGHVVPVATKTTLRISFAIRVDYGVQIFFPPIAAMAVENADPADPIKFRPSRLIRSARRRKSRSSKRVNGGGCPKTWISP